MCRFFLITLNGGSELLVGEKSGRERILWICFGRDEIRRDGVGASEGLLGALDDPSEGFWPRRDAQCATERCRRQAVHPTENHFGVRLG